VRGARFAGHPETPTGRPRSGPGDGRTAPRRRTRPIPQPRQAPPHRRVCPVARQHARARSQRRLARPQPSIAAAACDAGAPEPADRSCARCGSPAAACPEARSRPPAAPVPVRGPTAAGRAGCRLPRRRSGPAPAGPAARGGPRPATRARRARQVVRPSARAGQPAHPRRWVPVPRRSRPLARPAAAGPQTPATARKTDRATARHRPGRPAAYPPPRRPAGSAPPDRPENDPERPRPAARTRPAAHHAAVRAAFPIGQASAHTAGAGRRTEAPSPTQRRRPGPPGSPPPGWPHSPATPSCRSRAHRAPPAPRCSPPAPGPALDPAPPARRAGPATWLRPHRWPHT
jgi:hypothetical protein